MTLYGESTRHIGGIACLARLLQGRYFTYADDMSKPRVADARTYAREMTEEEWLDLVPVLPVQARGLLRQRRPLADRVTALLARLGVHDRGLGRADPRDWEG